MPCNIFNLYSESGSISLPGLAFAVFIIVSHPSTPRVPLATILFNSPVASAIAPVLEHLNVPLALPPEPIIISLSLNHIIPLTSIACELAEIIVLATPVTVTATVDGVALFHHGL